MTRQTDKRRICANCKTEKEIEEFYLNNKTKYYNSHCKDCMFLSSSIKRNSLKAIAVEYKGGCCEKCGYSKCLMALEFHHLDPSQKDFTISQAHHYDIEYVKKELDKCMLLCANCHRETHYELGRKNKIQIKNRVKHKEDRKNNPIPINIRPKFKIEWPTPEEMSKLIWQLSTVKVAAKLGVSDKAVEKFCTKHGIDKPGRGYWRKVETGTL